MDAKNIKLEFSPDVLLHKEVSVWWRNEDDDLKEYSATIVEQGDEKQGEDWFRIFYADGDEEMINLRTLETSGELGARGERRVRWCLKECTDVNASQSADIPTPAKGFQP